MKKLLRKLAVLVMCLFTFLGLAACELDLKPDEDNCAYGFQSTPLTANEFTETMTKFHNGTMTVTEPVMMYHLKADCTWTGDLKLPDGVSVGICCFKSSLTFLPSVVDGVEVIPNIDEDLYVYDCTRHGCFAAMDEAIPLTQVYLDFAQVKAKAEDTTFKLAPQLYVLNETLDYDVLMGLFSDPTKTSLSYCNGYRVTKTVTVTDEEGVETSQTVDATDDLIAQGVTVYLPENCVEPEWEDKTVHTCFLVSDTQPFNQVYVDYFAEQLAAGDYVVSQNPVYNYFFVHLTESITFDEPFLVPDGLYLGICTNGYQVNGEYSSNVYIYDCTPHACVDNMGEEMFPLWQSYLDIQSSYVTARGGTPTIALNAGSYALMQDIDLTGWTLTSAEESDIKPTLCKNGHEFTGATLPEGVVDERDCTKTYAETGPYEHVCDELAPHITAIELRAVDFAGYTDPETGVSHPGLINLETGKFEISGWDGELAIALGEDILLPIPIIIPTGMRLHLCLNGHYLRSDFVGDTKKMITVEYGAELTVCDCSAEQTGAIWGHYIYKESKTDESGATVTEEQSDYAYSIYNLGKFTLNSGTLAGGIGVYNAGLFVMNGGQAIGLMMAVLQISVDAHDYPLQSSYISSQIYGGKLISSAVGVISAVGQFNLHKTTVQSLVAGIMVGSAIPALLPVATDSLFTLNDVSVEITTSIVPILTYYFANETYADDAIEYLSDSYIGLSSNQNVNINGDFNVTIDEELLVPYVNENGETVEPKKIDFELFEDGFIDLADDVEPSMQYTVALTTTNTEEIPVTARPVVNQAMREYFIPVGDVVSYENTDNELVFVPLGGGDAATAVTQYSVSTDGMLQMNFYCTIGTDFAANANARILVCFLANSEATVPERVLELSVDEGTNLSDTQYVFSVGVAAKDYQQELILFFSDGNSAWQGMDNSVSIEKYLGYVITYVDDPETTNDDIYSEVKQTALMMLNYCRESAEYFATLQKDAVYATDADGNETTAETLLQAANIENIMQAVTTQAFENEIPTLVGKTDFVYKAKTSGTLPEGVSFVGVSLILDYGTAIRFYFKAKSIDNLNCTVNGVAAYIHAVKGGYYVEVANINAVRLCDMQTVCIGGYTIEYSVLSYVYGVLAEAESYAEGETVPQELQRLTDVAKGIVLYWGSAYQYFNADSDDAGSTETGTDTEIEGNE